MLDERLDKQKVEQQQQQQQQQQHQKQFSKQQQQHDNIGIQSPTSGGRHLRQRRAAGPSGAQNTPSASRSRPSPPSSPSSQRTTSPASICNARNQLQSPSNNNNNSTNQRNKNINSSSELVDDECEQTRYRPQKYCSVCGDKAIACNFNAVTCESCKAFFRRNAFKELQLKCLFDNSCVIDRVTRRFCSKCRLLKCFKIGMKREWILTDEQKQIKRVKIMQNKQSRNQNQESTGTSPLGSTPPPSDLPEKQYDDPSQQQQRQQQHATSDGVRLNRFGVEMRDAATCCSDEIDQQLLGPYCTLSSQCRFCSDRLASVGTRALYDRPPAPAQQQQHQLLNNAYVRLHQHPHRPASDSDTYLAASSGEPPAVVHQLLPPLPPPPPPPSCCCGSQIQPMHQTHFQNQHQLQLSQLTGQQAPFSSTIHHHHHQRASLAAAPAPGQQIFAATCEQSWSSALPAGPQLAYETMGTTTPQLHVLKPASGAAVDLCQATTAAATTPQLRVPEPEAGPQFRRWPEIPRAADRQQQRPAVYQNPFTIALDAMSVSDSFESEWSGEADRAPALAPITSGVPEPESATEAPQTPNPALSQQLQHSTVTRPTTTDLQPGTSSSDPAAGPAPTVEPIDTKVEQMTSLTGGQPVANEVDELAADCYVGMHGETYYKPADTEEEVLARVNRLDFSESEKHLIYEMIEATSFLFQYTHIKKLEEGPSKLDDLVYFCDAALRRLIKSVKQIKAFKMLSMDDQIKLLKSACFKILLLRSGYHFLDEVMGWYDPTTGKHSPLAVLKKAKKSLIYEKHLELLKTPWPLRKDRIIVATLSMALLFEPDIDLKHTSSVGLDNLIYLSILRKYLVLLQPDPLAKYERLIDALRSLYAANDEYNAFFSKDFQPEQVTPLLIEIFDIPKTTQVDAL